MVEVENAMHFQREPGDRRKSEHLCGLCALSGEKHLETHREMRSVSRMRAVRTHLRKPFVASQIAWVAVGKKKTSQRLVEKLNLSLLGGSQVNPGAQGVDLVDQLFLVLLAGGLLQLGLQLRHFLLAVIATLQFRATFDHNPIP